MASNDNYKVVDMILNKVCAICLESISEEERCVSINDTMVVTKNICCDHGMHSSCLTERLKMCPYCRADWVSVEDI